MAGLDSASVRVCYDDGYYVALPEGHPFPMAKFPALLRILQREGLVVAADIQQPVSASWEQLELVHGSDYLVALREGLLDRRAERRMGLPWSVALVERSRLAVGGTILTARLALQDGLAANLAGGTHHAFADYGEGFCVLNDVAVAIRLLRAEGALDRALVIDLDVHQGNGTAAIFEDDPKTYTFSMHGARNFPFEKQRSSIDVELADQIADEEYLATLSHHLPHVIRAAGADLAIYLAGVDPVSGDRYGRLALTPAGLAGRDGYVLRALCQAGLPTALVLSGGYAPTPEQTAHLHAYAHREAAHIARPPGGAATSMDG